MRRELVFLLEEESARVLLDSLLPRLLDSTIAFRLIAFEGKQDLEKRMVGKLRGYINPHARFIVMRDQDSAPDCRTIKARLLAKCAEAGRESVTLVRIACRALETFYLADLDAVGKTLSIRHLGNQQESAKFRAPDYMEAPDHELGKLTNQAYQKVRDSRRLGAVLDLSNTRSISFANLIRAIKRLETELLVL